MALEATGCPAWRKQKNGGSGVSTADMIAAIGRYLKRYNQLGRHHRSFYQKQAMAEHLHQVNNIEGEGFDSFKETKQAVDSGAHTTNNNNNDERLEAVCCLHRALMHCFDHQPAVATGKSILDVSRIVESHRLLLSSTKPEIAGRIRCKEEDVVFVETNNGVHVFTWPTEVPSALESLISSTTRALNETMKQQQQLEEEERISRLLKLAANFFFQFECLHPFIDGNGRIGRILLATLLREIMPFPNVLFVDVWPKSKVFGAGCPPFVPRRHYYNCFVKAQCEGNSSMSKEVSKLRSESCKFLPPEDLTALVTEGVYVGWKRFFQALDARTARATESQEFQVE